MPIQNRIAEFYKEMKQWRHYFHEFPELAYNEINTSKKVVQLLKKFKVDKIETGIGGTGVVATITNGKENQLVSGLIWTPCLLKKKIKKPTVLKIKELCMHVVMTVTQPCYWAL